MAVVLVPVGVGFLLLFQVEERVIARGVVESADQVTVGSPMKDVMVREILVEDGGDVEHDQPLIILADLQGLAAQISSLEQELRHYQEKLAALSDEQAAPRLALAQFRAENAYQKDQLRSLLPTADITEVLAETTATGTLPDGLMPASSALAQASLEVEHRHQELVRVESLEEEGVISGSKLEAARLNLRRAELAAETVAQRLRDQLRDLVYQHHDTAANIAEVEAQVARQQRSLKHQLVQARLELSALKVSQQRLTIRAPFSGRVVGIQASTSQRVEIGTDLITLSGNEPKLIKCRVPESRFSEIKLGQSALIKSDLYNYLRHEIYRGKVHFVATHGVYDGTEIFYDVSIVITEGHDVLRVGSGALCEIQVGQQSAIMLLVGKR